MSIDEAIAYFEDLKRIKEDYRDAHHVVGNPYHAILRSIELYEMAIVALKEKQGRERIKYCMENYCCDTSK